VELERLEEEDFLSFPGLHTFTSAACALLKQKDIKKIGKQITEMQERIPLRATIDENSITGTVIYTDSYGNVITNIKRELFDRIGKKHSFEIYVQSKHYMINKIYQNYSQMSLSRKLTVGPWIFLGMITIFSRWRRWAC